MSRQAEALEVDMEYSDIAGTSLKGSRVALGTWAIGGWPTCEVVLTENPAHLTKVFDPAPGIALIKL